MTAIVLVVTKEFIYVLTPCPVTLANPIAIGNNQLVDQTWCPFGSSTTPDGVCTSRQLWVRVRIFFLGHLDLFI